MRRMRIAVLIVGALLLLGFIANAIMAEYNYGRAIERGQAKIAAGHNGDAAVYFERLQLTYAENPEKLAEITENLITSYRNLAASPDLEIAQRRAVLLEIEKVDPAALTAAERKIVDAKK